MLARFVKNDRLRLDAIASQLIVEGNHSLAEEIDRRGELLGLDRGTVFIEQGGTDNDVFLILAGVCDVVINGRVIAKRGPGSHVGEMAAVQPSQPRSASCVAAENIVVIKLSEPDFAELGAA